MKTRYALESRFTPHSISTPLALTCQLEAMRQADRLVRQGCIWVRLVRTVETRNVVFEHGGE